MLTNSVKTIGKKWKFPLIIVGVLVLVLMVLKFAKPSPPKAESQEKSWLVNTKTLAFVTASPQIALLGTVESPFDSQLSAALTTDVTYVPVREGQSVSKGQLLIELDAREISLQLKQRQADVQDLDAQIKAEQNRFKSDQKSLKDENALRAISNQALARQTKLKASNLVAQERIEQAESQLAQSSLAITSRELSIADHPNRLQQLKAKLTRAQTAYENAQIDVQRTQITAPFDGVITEVNVAPGERVQNGQALTRIYDSKAIEVRAQLPDRHMALIRSAIDSGATISARAQHYGERVDLNLERLSGQANRGAGGVDALFIPQQMTDASPKALVLNSSLKIFVDLPALDKVVTLPVSAIYATKRVYRVNDSRLEAVEIKVLGSQQNKDGRSLSIITSPHLRAGDLIVTTQLPNAISGLKVTVREP